MDEPREFPTDAAGASVTAAIGPAGDDDLRRAAWFLGGLFDAACHDAALLIRAHEVLARAAQADSTTLFWVVSAFRDHLPRMDAELRRTWMSAWEELRGRSDHAIEDLDRDREVVQALTAVREMIRPGVREEEVALELEYRMRRGGAEQVSFETIVAAGPDTALPHATPGRREIADGDFVMIDYGAVCDGYHSDETCTFAVGHASDRQQELYRLVLEAHDRAIRAVRAGVSCGEIDRFARACLAEAGMAGYFSHGTGHGVGLDVHEAPRLASGREEILQAGMVVTVEPGVYLPGVWGIRIEDTVLVKQEGCEILTRTSKELAVIEH